MNPLSMARLQLLHPVLRERWLAVAAESEAAGLPVVVSQGMRTYDQQAELFAMGRTKRSNSACRHNGILRPVGTCSEHPFGAVVTKAQPGWSQHQFGLALDAEPDDPSLPGLQPDWNANHPGWARLLLIARRHALAEGAEWRTFKDYPHFYPEELPANPTDQERELYKTAGLEGVWKWADEQIAESKRLKGTP